MAETGRVLGDALRPGSRGWSEDILCRAQGVRWGQALAFVQTQP